MTKGNITRGRLSFSFQVLSYPMFKEGGCYSSMHNNDQREDVSVARSIGCLGCINSVASKGGLVLHQRGSSVATKGIVARVASCAPALVSDSHRMCTHSLHVHWAW